MRILGAVLLVLTFSACSSIESETSDIAMGRAVFEGNCMVCHGEEARGLAENWKEKGR